MYGSYLFVDAAAKKDSEKENAYVEPWTCEKSKGHTCTWNGDPMGYYYLYQSSNGYVEEWDVGKEQQG